MPRRVEDIIRSDRRSIRDTAEEAEDVAPKKGAKPAAPKPERVREVPIHKLKMSAPIHVGDNAKMSKIKAPTTPAQRKAIRARMWWGVTVISVVALVAVTGYVASVYYSRATFTIVPVTIPAPVDTTIVATASSTSNYLSYKISSFTGDTHTSVQAITGAYSSTKAAGYVTIYNTYAKESQRLNAGTRLSSDKGLIYRMTGSVVVPGYTVSAKGVTIPGTLTVPVVADQAGAEYNLSKTANSETVFKIVGYLGGPRYNFFSGRIASSIVGGFAGQQKTVDKTLLASTTADLQAALTTQLLAKAKSAVPNGYVMYDNAYKTVFSSPVLSGTTTNSATVTVSGTLYAVLFNANDLVTKLVGADKVNSFSSYPYRAPGLESLSFTITNPNDFSPAKQNTLIAKVKGDVTLVGIIPVETLKDKLVGLSLAQTSSVLRGYSPIIDVSKSSGELFPSWSTSVPKDKSRITINVK